jgi:hypothetical protein
LDTFDRCPSRGQPDQGWGLLAAIRLPDGDEFPIYQPGTVRVSEAAAVEITS